ncbi:VOC family protein [Alicyclobacillus macrosporangiidus]|uniref:VOC family protein n=1 Tax=Alicyclobacillus macrosporangiidus TaxID=392015 RepID=UPI0018CC7956|nr:VOC family protein [Alicyclobacillus macrosporangiidus]
MMTVRFELFVRDVGKSVDFYVRALGFSPGKQSEKYSVLRNGNVQIGLGRLSDLPTDHPLQLRHADERVGVGVEIVLEVDDVEALYKKVQDFGYPIQDALTVRPWGLRDFRICDPDGYYLRITSKD